MIILPNSLPISIIPSSSSGAIWSPANIPTWAWYDVSDSQNRNIISNRISQLTDKSGNNRHLTQPSAQNRPILITAGLNNRDVAECIFSTDHRYLFSNISGSFTAWQMYAVASYMGGTSSSSSNISNRLVSFGANNDLDTSSNGFSFIRHNNTNDVALFSSSTTALASTTIGFNSWFLVTAGNSATTASIWLNGESSPASTVNAFGSKSPVAITVGARTATSTPTGTWDGRFAEIIILNYVASNSIQRLIEGYLAHKYNLVSLLPTFHLYKNSASVFR